MKITVIDLDNYKAEHQEDTPFDGELLSTDGLNYNVKSLRTGKEYEVYAFQIKEFS